MGQGIVSGDIYDNTEEKAVNSTKTWQNLEYFNSLNL